MTTTKKYCHNLHITHIDYINSDYFYVECKVPENVDIYPGQFVQIAIDNSSKVFLRRPFSVFDYDEEKLILAFLIKIVGEGTRALSKLKIDDYLDVVYPLGRGFTIPSEPEKVLLVGGGCGVAPLFYLARYLYFRNCIVDVIIGARSTHDILFPYKYSQFGVTDYITEDGSSGYKGIITDHPVFKNKERLTKYNKIYVCGPEKMMKEVGKIALENNIDCEISLENLMACGIGACLCCVVKSDEGNVCTCTEGPVFNIKKLTHWLYS